MASQETQEKKTTRNTRRNKLTTSRAQEEQVDYKPNPNDDVKFGMWVEDAVDSMKKKEDVGYLEFGRSLTRWIRIENDIDI
ncbi:hypothetical protein Tco_1028228 [Tanacetum coccineum]|uniref:Uncharacterized protein n=1 Tax=Tanacetum coccineum TaxID=301880 RepID=A0ABQ5G015_9ASTR